MNNARKRHQWPSSRGHHKSSVQMTFLVSVSIKLKMQICPRQHFHFHNVIYILHLCCPLDEGNKCLLGALFMVFACSYLHIILLYVYEYIYMCVCMCVCMEIGALIQK